ncbi:RfaE bifunctional protein [Candidatus Glomeribacter gigasporarum BEG34]|uniref:RfaE bifunctional protein n=1 Tax=Candidatus Glomeribacter gigasporarum BEG34 TaxID=1070319 RepID=G2J9W1_9BURK|nr:adenylyltransferase/cytidyltransferase family protein [Candidatus Glomeribacter gigasporarum]CCD29558.1 RfaE bifunctional protein [Candidatus Glomeribacter gigasporarum BEG34]
MAAHFERKLIDCHALATLRATLPAPVIFTNGVFDILHRGHISYLDAARALGTCLIVGINSDASVRTLNKGEAGEQRPINDEADRMALVAALESVDWVVRFSESNPMALIEALRPDVLVKGGDYDMDALPEAALARRWGGRAVSIPFEYQRSTSALLRRIRTQGS